MPCAFPGILASIIGGQFLNCCQAATLAQWVVKNPNLCRRFANAHIELRGQKTACDVSESSHSSMMRSAALLSKMSNQGDRTLQGLPHENNFHLTAMAI